VEYVVKQMQETIKRAVNTVEVTAGRSQDSSMKVGEDSAMTYSCWHVRRWPQLWPRRGSRDR